MRLNDTEALSKAAGVPSGYDAFKSPPTPHGFVRDGQSARAAQPSNSGSESLSEACKSIDEGHCR